MSRATRLGLVALSLVFVLFPLTVPKPGLPATLKADEPAYLLSALSLVRDLDLRCGPEDLQRLFDDYPYLTTKNLILATQDGWHSFTFAKPFLYPLFTTPLVALFGANGMVAFNMLLWVAMIWMASDYLIRRGNREAVAVLFAVGFFLLSSAFSYVFWLHPEIFMMASAMACLYFGLDVAARTDSVGRGWRRLLDPRWAPYLSGACLALGTYHKPVLGALGLPVMFVLARQRRWRALAAWLAAAALALGAAAGGSWLMAGYPTPYLGVDRAGFHIESPHEPVVDPATLAPRAQKNLDQRSAGWWWVFRVPGLDPKDLWEEAVYFLFGRHTGLFLYQPFALLALGLFVCFGARDPTRWVLLGALAIVAVFFVAWIPHNWHGGGGFVGNRYFIMAYPGFLFLVTRIRPPAAVVAGWAVGGLFLGPLVLTPFGTIVPQPTLQAHARGRPFQAFPYELSLKEVPGHHGVVIHAAYFLGRKDQIRPIDDEIWVQGNDSAEIWIQSETPLDTLAFDVRSQAPHNTIEIRIEDAHEIVVWDGGEPVRVNLRPSRATKRRYERDLRQPTIVHRPYAYRMIVSAATGELPRWRGIEPPHNFYLGAALAYRGDGLGPTGTDAPDP